jgi:hypothetical protein
MMKLIKTCSSAREKDPAAAVELKKNKELSGGKSSATVVENGWKIFSLSLSAQIIKHKHTRALV